jgi:hypothetical protein
VADERCTWPPEIRPAPPRRHASGQRSFWPHGSSPWAEGPRRAAFDEILANGLKRQHSIPQIIGDLLQAEIVDRKRKLAFQKPRLTPTTSPTPGAHW